MHELAAKFGALALSPFFVFGAQAATADHVPEAKQSWNNTPAWQQFKSWAGGEQRKALAITSIEGPSAVAVNASGEWTVNAKSRGSSDLQYSVVWGDEASVSARSMMAAEATQSSATFSHTYEAPGTYKPAFTVTDSKGRTATKSMKVTVGEDGTVHLESLSVTTGAVGATVVAHGDYFTASSTVTVGGVRATDVTYNDEEETLTFVVPSLRAGEYNVRVHGNGERSNALAFTVTATAPRLSVSGVDAPVRLAVGAEGTWTVRAATQSANLKYSVVWGDEGSASARMMQSDEQTSATFTHTYDTAGTYKPKFTVTDDSGRTATVSALVVVR